MGKGVVEELANFIKNKEPNIKGFTARNMWMMKQFFETYNDFPKLHTLCTVLSWSHNRRIIALKTDEEREFDNLRFQNGTSSEHGGRRYLQNKVSICSQRYLKVKWKLTHDI